MLKGVCRRDLFHGGCSHCHGFLTDSGFVPRLTMGLQLLPGFTTPSILVFADGALHHQVISGAFHALMNRFKPLNLCAASEQGDFMHLAHGPGRNCCSLYLASIWVHSVAAGLPQQ